MNTTVADDICTIACIFSHDRNPVRMENLRRFCEGLHCQGIPVFFAELAYGNTPFLIDPEIALIQSRSSNRMWHKERLLNNLVKYLPDKFSKVVWADTDLIFVDDSWMNIASEKLDDFQVIQPYATAVRLNAGQTYACDTDTRITSFGKCYASSRFDLSAGVDIHGHTGFAWAAHREFLESVGLFEYCISGSGDHLMAHGFLGDVSSYCIERHLLGAPKYKKRFSRWATRAAARTKMRIGYVESEIFHLFHGKHDGNAYMRRGYELLQSGFNPDTDVQIDENGLFEITRFNHALKAWQIHHFGEGK